MSDKHGMIWWSELMTREPRAARAYYGAVCGWTWESVPMPDGEYHVASAQGKPVAGAMDMTGLPGMKQAPAHWFTYIAVDDVDAATMATEERGGKVIRAPWNVPGIGRSAIVEDPTGAAVGLMTPSEPTA